MPPRHQMAEPNLAAACLHLFFALLVFATGLEPVRAQELVPVSTTDVDAVLTDLSELARKAIKTHEKSADAADRTASLDVLFRLQSVAGEHAAAAASLESLIALHEASESGSAAALRVFLVYEQARAGCDEQTPATQACVERVFEQVFAGLGDLDASRSLFWFGGDIGRFRADLNNAAGDLVGKAGIPLPAAISLLRKAHLLSTYELIVPLADTLIAQDDARRYRIDDELLIRTPDGADIAAIAVRPAASTEKLPTLLVFTIYADDAQALGEARSMAAHGYAGVVAYTRGKGRSPQSPIPYEHDGDDARTVIDWITRQPWSDGRVGMYGGSYNGFTQWAAAKKLPAALKTFVPYAANNPGNGLPLENNVFIFANYAWPFFAASGKFLDAPTYFNHSRWNALNERWYASGRSYREIDQIDGTPNPWFQRWLQHPAYDAYWQAMTPYREEFAQIDIPVLTITGYFDDGQQSALDYMRQHLAYRPDAAHYLLIGPYDHGGVQARRKPRALRGYVIDAVAGFDTPELTFQWMNHIFRDADMPELIRDKVNYQVMGANVWKHAASIEAMAGQRLRLYLSSQQSDATMADQVLHVLSTKPNKPSSLLEQRVDFSDRATSIGDHYPAPILGKELDASSGLLFASAPFEQQVEISGTFSGVMHVTINKRDFDFSATLYERKASGELFHLSYFLGRASHADSMEARSLLQPGKRTEIRFDRSRMTSRRLEAGSRLLLAVTVNKNAYAQINHGSGKDVSDEGIGDAGVPLRVRWHSDSHIIIPLSQ